MISLDSFLSKGEAVGALIRDVQSGRAPHALLLTGIPGAGKRTLARLLACALLCTEEQKPCLQCKSCRRVLNGTHPDLLTPACGEKEKTIKVDSMRRIIRDLSLHSSEGGARVVLLEDAQRIVVQAQNAMLKSLEEPASGTHFLLTVSGDTGLLPTVRSRCRVVRLPAWERSQVEHALLSRGAPLAAAKDIAVLCGGSLGLALSMYSDPAFLKTRELCEKTFFSLCTAADVPAASLLLREQKEDADALLSLLIRRVREYMLYALQAGPRPPVTDSTLCDESWAHASPRALEKVAQAVIDAERYRHANVSWAAVCERLLYIISEEIPLWQQS